MSPLPPASVSGALSAASINIAKVTEIDRIVAELQEYPELGGASILMLQEVARAAGGQLSAGEMLARRLGFNVEFASPDGEKTVAGLATLTRYPLRDKKVLALRNVNLIFRTRKRVALAVTVDTPGGSIRVINAHLDTRINPKERIEQLGPALADAAAFGGPVIIGGDFNTNDMQWISHVVPLPYPGWQAAAVRRLMTERGFSTPFEVRRATFDHLRMQLDWLFTTGLTPLRSGVRPLDFSDHHAIWAEFAPAQARVAAAAAANGAGSK
jgi:endonuclease/exonuclease/phosphatase family metal-dependent hydrolase